MRDPAGRLAEVLEFLALDYEPEVAQGYGNREGIPERELAWKGRALEPIRPDRAGRWRRELSALEVARLQRLGGGALSRLGYELSCAAGRGRLTPWFVLRLVWGIADCLAHLPLRTLAAEATRAAKGIAQTG